MEGGLARVRPFVSTAGTKRRPDCSVCNRVEFPPERATLTEAAGGLRASVFLDKMSGFLVGTFIVGAAIAGFLGTSRATVPGLAVLILALWARDLFPTSIHGVAGPDRGFVA